MIASSPTPGRPRRWPFAVGGTALVVACIAVGWWFLWLPNWRPHLHAGEQFGVDVSAHQGEINWAKVADDDIGFTYIKATEGGDFEDPRFASNWRGAAEAGLHRGAYHFFTLCTAGVVQAQQFIRVTPPDPAALAPAVDLELAGNCKDRPTPAAVENQLSEFLSIVEHAWHNQTVLYVGDDFERRYPVRKRLDRPLWHRRFLRRPDLKHWIIWQLHGYARVSGIKGQVDLDVMRPSP